MSSLNANLADLPRELIDFILDFLTPSDFLSFRLVCRGFDEASFAVFADAYFSTIMYDFSHYDTEYLKLFAREERLLPHVKTLRICRTSCPRIVPGTKSYFAQKAFGQGYEWNREIYGSVTDQNPQITEFGELLKDRFTNCRNICITNKDVQGISQIFSSRWLTPNDAFNILLHVIIRQSLEVKSFKIDYSGDGYVKEVDPARLFSLMERWSYSNMYIQSLSLCVGLGMGLDWMAHFIHRLQNLQSLHLQLDAIGTEADRFFYKIGAAAEPMRIGRLSLENISIRSDEALGSLFRHLRSTMTCLSLRSIRLHDGQWQTLLQTIASFCLLLSDLSIEFALSEQECYPIHFCSIIEVAQLYGVQSLDKHGYEEWKRSSACVRYSGQHVADAIGALSYKIEMHISPESHN